jgi:hypothetical protein
MCHGISIAELAGALHQLPASVPLTALCGWSRIGGGYSRFVRHAGRGPMLKTIVGGAWIAAGLYIVLRPTALQGRLQRKGAKWLRALLFVGGLFLSGTLISFGWQHEGFLPKALMVIGIVGLAETLLLLRRKGTEALVALSARIPTLALRIGGAVYIAIGAYLIWFRG